MDPLQAAGYEYKACPAKSAEAKSLGKIFGLSKNRVGVVENEVFAAVEFWENYAQQAGVVDINAKKVQSYFRM